LTIQIIKPELSNLSDDVALLTYFVTISPQNG